MKLAKFTHVVVLGLVLTVAFTGCRKRPGSVTPLPQGAKVGMPGDDLAGGTPLTPGGPGTGTENPTSKDASATGGIAQNPVYSHAGWPENAEIFKQDTVYFDFDKSAIRPSEGSKIKSVADYLRANSNTAVRVEGHCDERGTEEYNRALGERRANSAREELVRLGIESGRLDTISYGKDRPADPGQTREAHAKNRRDEFILLTPPAAP